MIEHDRLYIGGALVKSAGTGAFLGLTVGGPTGAVVGAAGTTALTGLTIARRSRATRKRIAKRGR